MALGRSGWIRTGLSFSRVLAIIEEASTSIFTDRQDPGGAGTCRNGDRYRNGIAGEEMTDGGNRVLIVDDEFLIQELLTIVMEQMGLTVCGTAATAERAVELAREHRPNLVLMDMRLEGRRDGVDAAIEIGELGCSKIIFITGSREPKTLTRIQTTNPEAIIFKPFADRQLRNAVEVALGA